MSSPTAETYAGTEPQEAKRYLMMIGGREWELRPRDYPVEDVRLWDENPRTLHLQRDVTKSEDEIAADLASTPGYDSLKASIRRQGQLERIFVQERSHGKPLVIEGNTRVAILRELRAEHEGKPRQDEFGYVRAKILPAALSQEDIVFLQAAIHVRGSGVRNWSRYAQARFVYDAVTPKATGMSPKTTQARLAEQMGKSASWVNRLLHAYEFALKYIEHFDDVDGEAEAEAIDRFSILEEISRAKTFGPRVRDYEDPSTEPIREEVFDMVHRGVFKEYRDARLIQKFYEDEDKWRQLKEGEAGVAAKLAAEIKAGESTVADRVLALPGSLGRELQSKPDVFHEEHLQALYAATQQLESHLGGAVALLTRAGLFRRSLGEVSLGDLESIDPQDFDDLVEAIERVKNLAGKRIA